MEDLSLDREKSPPHFTPEYLTLCSKDGSTYQLSVEGGKLKNLTQTPLHVSEAGGGRGGRVRVEREGETRMKNIKMSSCWKE